MLKIDKQKNKGDSKYRRYDKGKTKQIIPDIAV